MLSSKVERRSSNISGSGIFACENILKGEILIEFTGKYISEAEAAVIWDDGIDYMLQLDDNLFILADLSNVDDAYFINHSCNPNCGIRHSNQIVAMRSITNGEEITFDYAMTENTDYQIKCSCNSLINNKSVCRKIITGDDWKIPSLQIDYKGYFSSYLADKIFISAYEINIGQKINIGQIWTHVDNLNNVLIDYVDEYIYIDHISIDDSIMIHDTYENFIKNFKYNEELTAIRDIIE